MGAGGSTGETRMCISGVRDDRERGEAGGGTAAAAVPPGALRWERGVEGEAFLFATCCMYAPSPTCSRKETWERGEDDGVLPLR